MSSDLLISVQKGVSTTVTSVHCYLQLEPTEMACSTVRGYTDNCNIFDPTKYNDLKSRSGKEDAAALQKTIFLETPQEDHVHLDIGCGPGTFAKEFLLPRSRPCKRLVAVDRSPTMVKFARENSAHERIAFDVFDFCGEDAGKLIAKYGQFNRVYSFLCFHFVKDEQKAFKELARLLTPNSGECLITAAVSCAPFDAWLDLHLMERWREVIPDPRPLLSEQFSFNFAKSKAQVESDVRLMTSRAGLRCLALEVYESAWSFPNAYSCADALADALGLGRYVSQEDIGELKRDMAFLMCGGSMLETQEYLMQLIIYSLHAQSAHP